MNTHNKKSYASTYSWVPENCIAIIYTVYVFSIGGGPLHCSVYIEVICLLLILIPLEKVTSENACLRKSLEKAVAFWCRKKIIPKTIYP